MKKTLLSLLTLITLHLNAQVVMVNIKPSFGTQYKLNTITSTFSNLSEGATQNWDLSAATTTGLYTFTVVDPSTLSAQIKDSVPDASFGTKIEIGGPNPDLAPYDFYKDLTTCWVKIGSKGSGSGAVERKYDTAMLFTQTYSSTEIYGGMQKIYSGYGTLIIGTQTFNNVVMIKSTPLGSTDYGVQLFQFTPYHQVLLSYSNIGGVIQNKFFWEPLSSTGISQVGENLNFLVFPNPARQSATMLLPENFDGIITLTDLSGREVFRNHTNQQELKLDLSSLQKGVYFLTAETGSKHSVQKLIVE